MNQPATFRTSLVTLLPNKRKSFRIVTIFEVFSAVYGDFYRFLRFPIFPIMQPSSIMPCARSLGPHGTLRRVFMPCAPPIEPHSTLWPGIHAMCAVKRTTWHASAGYSCHVRRQKDHMARFGRVFMPCAPSKGPHGALELKGRAFSQGRPKSSKTQVKVILNLKRKMHGREIHALYKHLNIKLFRKTSAQKGKPKN